MTSPRTLRAARPERLDERGRRAEVALLVGVQDRDQGHLRDVEPLPKQVDADQRVELAQPEVADHLDALEGVDVGVEVADAEAHLEVVLAEVLGHPLGQRGHQHPLVALGPRTDLLHEVVHLLAGGADRDGGVGEPGRPDDLLGDGAVGLLELVGRRGGRDVEHLAQRPP